MARSNDRRTAFRCSIPPERSGAQLKVGKRRHAVSVVDTSSEGFSVRMPTKLASRLTAKRTIVLYFAKEKWQVEVSSSYCEFDQTSIVGFTRIKELTKIVEPSSWGLSMLPRINAQSDPTFLAYLMIVFLIAVVCLPGLGDGLGTAPQVRKHVKSVIKGFQERIF